jgi:hypothetical protein
MTEVLRPVALRAVVGLWIAVTVRIDVLTAAEMGVDVLRPVELRVVGGSRKAERCIVVGPRKTERCIVVGLRMTERCIVVGLRKAERCIVVGLRKAERCIVVGLRKAEVRVDVLRSVQVVVVVGRRMIESGTSVDLWSVYLKVVSLLTELGVDVWSRMVEIRLADVLMLTKLVVDILLRSRELKVVLMLTKLWVDVGLMLG